MNNNFNWLKKQMNRPLTSEYSFEVGYNAAVERFNHLFEQSGIEAVSKSPGPAQAKGSNDEDVERLIASFSKRVEDINAYLEKDAKVSSEDKHHNQYDEEVKFEVVDNSMANILCKVDGRVMSSRRAVATGRVSSALYKLTRQEVMDYDERYILFMVPVEGDNND